MMIRQVKARIGFPALALLFAATVFSTPLRAKDAPPSGEEILQRLRTQQMQQHRTLAGELRNGATTSPFRLVLDGATIKYQFTTPPPYTLVLHLGANSSQLDEVTLNGKSQVKDANFATPVRGTDLTFEDVAMRFLYWPTAKLLGEDSMNAAPGRKCWKLELKPAAGAKSAYASVVVWIDEGSGAMLRAQAFDAAGQLATEFKLIEPQMLGGVWLPKKVRIQRMKDGEPVDSTPTYLMIDKVLKS